MPLPLSRSFNFTGIADGAYNSGWTSPIPGESGLIATGDANARINGGCLELVPQTYINHATNQITLADRASAGYGDQQIAVRVLLATPGRRVNVYLHGRLSGSSPTRANLVATIMQDATGNGAVIIELGVWQQDPTGFIYANSYNLATVANGGTFDPPTGSIGAWLVFKSADANPGTVTLELRAAASSLADDTIDALLWSAPALTTGSGGTADPGAGLRDWLLDGEIFLGSSNFGSNAPNIALTGNGQVISAKFDAADSMTVPLVVPVPTRASSALGTNNLAVAATGGSGTYTTDWRVENDIAGASSPGTFADMTPITDANAHDLLVSHTFTPDIAVRHGVKVAGRQRLYSVSVNDGGSAVGSGFSVFEDDMAQDAVPALAPDILLGRPVIISALGDSRTAPTSFTTAMNAAMTAAGINGTFINNGTPSSWLEGNLTFQNWQPDAAGGLNLYNGLKTNHLAARTSHPGALEIVEAWIGVNDFSNSNWDPSLHVAAINAICDGLKADLGANLNIVWNEEGLNRNADTGGVGVQRQLLIRNAILGMTDRFLGDTNQTYYGTFQITGNSRIQQDNWMADFVHYLDPYGVTQVVNLIFDAMRRGPLQQKANAAPQITVQPSATNIVPGGSGQINATVTGATWCRWQKSDGAGGWAYVSGTSGATTAPLAFTNAQAGDAGNYRLIVANDSGSVTSAVVSLTVSDTPPTDSRIGGIYTDLRAGMMPGSRMMRGFGGRR